MILILLSSEFNYNSASVSPSIASDSTGNFIVTWYDYRNNYAQIYAQRFVDNKISGANFTISEDELKGSKSYVACAMNDSGNLIAAWLDYGEPNEYRILSRLIDSNQRQSIPAQE